MPISGATALALHSHIVPWGDTSRPKVLCSQPLALVAVTARHHVGLLASELEFTAIMDLGVPEPMAPLAIKTITRSFDFCFGGPVGLLWSTKVLTRWLDVAICNTLCEPAADPAGRTH